MGGEEIGGYVSAPSKMGREPHCAMLIFVLCHSSDADSDVLADYVLALIRADTPEPELRLNAIENLEDFLKDSRQPFCFA